VPQGIQQTTVQNRTVRFNNYLNKDVRENYYTFKAPDDWHVNSGTKPGSYDFTFPRGSGDVALIDVPDNSTLELFILSQQEPSLKKTRIEYARKGYEKMTVNGNDAYVLTFSSVENGRRLTTSRTYVAGFDNAAVFTFSTDQLAFSGLSSLFAGVTGSFVWKNNR